MHLPGRFSSGGQTLRTESEEPRTVDKQKKNASRLDPALAERIVAEVREEEIVAMSCDVINIPSPTGEELHMAEYMQMRLEQLGLNVTWQEVEENRANVVARWIGSGGGRNLMFNGHMDTSNTGREDFLTGAGYKPFAQVKDGFIYGLGIYNMKVLAVLRHLRHRLHRDPAEAAGDETQVPRTDRT